jgi:hypothetical protein
MTATMTSPPATTRRPRRIGIEAHTEFVATLVAELRSSVTDLQAASGALLAAAATPAVEGHVDLLDTTDFDRRTGDVARLVRLLDAIDGTGADRRPAGLSLPSFIVDVAKGFELPVTVEGEWGPDLFVADAESLRTGLELLFLSLAGEGRRAEIRVVNERLVVIDATVELTDPRACWQLRCARRVLEGEGCGVRLIRTGTRCRLELRVQDH